MRGIKFILFFLLSILFCLVITGYVSATADFSITSTTPITASPYKGDLVKFKGVVKSDSGNYCPITCQYSIGSNAGYVSDSGSAPASELNPGNSQEFPFSMRAEGTSSPVSLNLVVSCDRVPNYINCWPGSSSNSKTVYLYYLYSGDGVCTTSREKCKYYQTFIGTNDCSCSFGKECRPDGTRNVDGNGCQTYCGNGMYEPDYEDCSCSTDFSCDETKKCKLDNSRAGDSDGCVSFCGNGFCEKEYENCNNCSQDCKKCDLMPCQKKSDCQGNYCVWNICWSSPTRAKDGHCDLDVGENCANSPEDCSCDANQRCNSEGFCEYYCGNGVCEESEKGVCKADCRWCGDGTCQSNENCATCSDDCGPCRGVNNTVVNTIVTTVNYSTSSSNLMTNGTQNNSDKQNSRQDSSSEDNPSSESSNTDSNLNDNISEKNINESVVRKNIDSNIQYIFNKAFLKDNFKEVILVFLGIIVLIILLFVLIKKEGKQKIDNKKDEEK
jgi:hypothetical protein